MSDRGAASIAHPAQRRLRVGLAALMFGFWGGPIASTAVLLVNYGLASHVCYPGPVPRAAVPVDWRWLTPALLAFDVLALLTGIAATGVAYRAFVVVRQEMRSDTRHLFEIGEGRSRFLALWGIVTSGGFLLIIILEILSLLVVPTCGR